MTKLSNTNISNYGIILYSLFIVAGLLAAGLFILFPEIFTKDSHHHPSTQAVIITPDVPEDIEVPEVAEENQTSEQIIESWKESFEKIKEEEELNLQIQRDNKCYNELINDCIESSARNLMLRAGNYNLISLKLQAISESEDLLGILANNKNHVAYARIQKILEPIIVKLNRKSKLYNATAYEMLDDGALLQDTVTAVVIYDLMQKE